MKLSYRIEYGILVVFQKVFQILSYPKISDLGAWLGRFFWLTRIRKKVAWDNIRHCLPHISEEGSRQILLGSYENLGRTFIELLFLRKIDCRRSGYICIEACPEFFQNPQRQAVYISCHLGNWELMAKMLVNLGVRLGVVVRRQSNPLVDRLINRQREDCGIRTVSEEDLHGIRSLIDSGYSIGLVSDQDFGDNTIPVHFFGRPCFAPGGPEFFSNKFGLRVFTCFAVREKSYHHKIIINSFHSTDQFAQGYTNQIETAIREFPDQWLWHHRRWKVHP